MAYFEHLHFAFQVNQLLNWRRFDNYTLDSSINIIFAIEMQIELDKK
jgi:hypothetical protein